MGFPMRVLVSYSAGRASARASVFGPHHYLGRGTSAPDSISCAASYNSVRTHRSLHGDSPIFPAIHPAGIIRSHPVLAGFTITTFGFEFSVHTGLAPNFKGNEPFAPGWAFVFDLQAGFDPYFLQFANGPGSVAQTRVHTRLTGLLALHEIVKFAS